MQRSAKPVAVGPSERPTAEDLSEAARLLSGLPGLIPSGGGLDAPAMPQQQQNESLKSGVGELVAAAAGKEGEAAEQPAAASARSETVLGVDVGSALPPAQPPAQTTDPPRRCSPAPALLFWEGGMAPVSSEGLRRPLQLGEYDPMSVRNGMHGALSTVVQSSIKLAPAAAAATGVQEAVKKSGDGGGGDLGVKGTSSLQREMPLPMHPMVHPPPPTASDDGGGSSRGKGSKRKPQQQSASGSDEGHPGRKPEVPPSSAVRGGGAQAADPGGKKGGASGRPPLRPSLNLQPSVAKRSG